MDNQSRVFDVFVWACIGGIFLLACIGVGAGVWPLVIEFLENSRG